MVDQDAVPLPIDGVLDLHTFSPKDIGELIPDYIVECLKREIYQVRIIHGKGTGSLRRSVWAILDRLPQVETYWTPSDESGWGATLVKLKEPLA